jgi:glucose/mannose-6-phosphate isomerase
MNLDDLNTLHSADTSRMIDQIRLMPEGVNRAWQTGRDFMMDIPTDISQIILCGTGTSYTAACILTAYLSGISTIPVTAIHGSTLPAWAQGEKTLVILTGLTGDEPELIRALTQCIDRECCTVVFSVGGKLLETAVNAGIMSRKFNFSGPARLAHSYAFFLPLGVLTGAGIIDIPDAEIAGIVNELEKTRDQIDTEVPVVSNPAKRLAGQFMNRLVTLFGSGWMLEVARLWKAQIHENAKAWAQVEEIGAASRSTVGGMYAPEEPLSQMMTLFLESPFDAPESLAVSGKIRELFMVEGFNTDYYIPSGDTQLKAMWTAILFGTYVSYYLAIAYGMDPLPNPGTEEMEFFLSEM